MNVLKTISLLTLLALLANCSCSKNSTEPPPKPPGGPDTTSHNFTWEIDTLGEFGSYLKDVAIINENNILAVGYLLSEDPQGNREVYNAVQWDGSRWRLTKIPMRVWNNNTYFPSRLETVFALSWDNIWASDGGQVVYNDGGRWFQHEFLFTDLNDTTFGAMTGIWAESSQRVWGVGYKGNLFYYDGNQWGRLLRVTNVDLLDIWGVPDGQGGSIVWACGYAFNNSSSVLLRFNGQSWQAVWNWNYQGGSSDSSYMGLLSTLTAVDSDTMLIVGGEGIYRQDIRGNSAPRQESVVFSAFPNCVRANAPNNIFIVGYDGIVWHYNGASWKTYPELRNSNWHFFSVSVSQDKVVVVGAEFSQGVQRALIITGFKQENPN